MSVQLEAPLAMAVGMAVATAVVLVHMAGGCAK